jgi:hypothetical protein
LQLDDDDDVGDSTASPPAKSTLHTPGWSYGESIDAGFNERIYRMVLLSDSAGSFRFMPLCPLALLAKSCSS